MTDPTEADWSAARAVQLHGDWTLALARAFAEYRVKVTADAEAHAYEQRLQLARLNRLQAEHAARVRSLQSRIMRLEAGRKVAS